MNTWKNGTKFAIVTGSTLTAILIGWAVIPGDPAPTWYALPAAILIPVLLVATTFGIMPAIFDSGFDDKLGRFMDWLDQ